MINQRGTWFLPESISPDGLIKKISKKFSVQVEPRPKKTVVYFDTHDWQLYKKKYLLDRTDHDWHLVRFDSGELVATLSDPDGPSRCFAHSFGNGPLKTILQEKLKVRCLLPMATFDVRSKRLRILNSDEKTVAHIGINSWTLHTEKLANHTVDVTGVRGYAGIVKKIYRFLHRCGVTEGVPPCYFFKEGVKSQGRYPGDYTSKFSITLDAAMSTRQAAVAIYKQLLTTMQANERGILNDIDSEFLHDFRVAMRRTRSGLSQIQGALPPAITQWIKKELAELGQITGPTRDLDVYLLYEQDYLTRLPESLQEGLAGFFAEMTVRRRQEWEKMVKTFKSAHYQKIMSDWQAYLDEDVMGGDGSGDYSENAKRPIGEYACKIIYRRFKRIIKKGRAINVDSPDAYLHRLRIQCKKLRYSLEFFASLFPKKEMERGIKQLRRLQTHLGDFNDLSVQQNMLQDYLTALRTGAKKHLKQAAAIGGLQTLLSREKKEVRNQFSIVFGEFSGSKNRNLYLKLFN